MLGSRVKAAARALVVAAACLLCSTGAAAHLRPIGGSLVELVARADAIVLAESVAPTIDRRDRAARTVAETDFRTIEVVAGEDPGKAFTVAADLPPQRYAAGQHGFVLLERSAGGWRACQPAGMALLIATETHAAGIASILAALWAVTRAATPRANDLAPILRRALRAPVPKIRLMAALDVADLVHHERLVAEEREATRAVLSDPDLDRASRAALATAFARAERREPPPLSDAGGTVP